MTPHRAAAKQLVVSVDYDFKALLRKLWESPSVPISKVCAYISQKTLEDPENKDIAAEYAIRSIEYIATELPDTFVANLSPTIALIQLLVSAPHSPKNGSLSQVQDFIAKHCEDYDTQYQNYCTLLNLIVLIRINDWDNAKALLAKSELQLLNATTCIADVYKLYKAKYLAYQELRSEEYCLRINLIASAITRQDTGLVLYCLWDWIDSLARLKQPEMIFKLVAKLYLLHADKLEILKVRLLYALFSLDDRLLPPTKKMDYVNDIFKLNVHLLNVQQLQSLYFFAGNYSSGIKSRFKESILYFQYSNYFLYKSWDYLRTISAFLRMVQSPEQYVQSIKFVEQQWQDFNNRVSLQNNAYVETLQADYEKIDELYKEVEELSLTDTLTGLHNRRYLQNNLNQLVLLSYRHKAKLSFVMIDLDHFKHINDTHGHLAGDYILKNVGALIKNHFRRSDLVVRYGGEEFFVALFDMPQEHVWQNLESLRVQVEKAKFVHCGKHIPLTISIGITLRDFLSSDEFDEEQIIQEADTALYMAKQSGRNRICMYDEDKVFDNKI